MGGAKIPQRDMGVFEDMGGPPQLGNDCSFPDLTHSSS